MAIQEYAYQETTHQQLLDCIEWCKDRFCLKDWLILLYTDPEPPIELDSKEKEGPLGYYWCRLNYLYGTIWIPLETAEKANISPYATIIHEMMHILFLGLAGLDQIETEIPIYRLEPIIYRQFCIEKNIKIADIKQITPKDF